MTSHRPKPQPTQPLVTGSPTYGYQQPQYAYPVPPVEPTKRRRVFRWTFIIIQVIFLIWIIAGAHAGHTDTSACNGLDAKTCQDAKDVGTSIGVGIIILLWAIVDVIFMLGRCVVLLGRRGNR